jgi:flavorubredoxin
MIKERINDGIYMLSMNVEDIYFESMWKLPHGVSLNSFVVKGDKTAIIDGVIGWDGVPETLYDHLKAIDVDPLEIDYLVVNHLEPDHSGWIEHFKKIKTDFTVVISPKGEEMLKSYYGEDLDVLVVKDGDTLDLGNEKVLSFHHIPNVHWPETMMTYETSTKTLFSCDMYGAFGVLTDRYFDTTMTDQDKVLYEEEGLRYFSNVLTTFSPMVKRAVAKTKTLDVKLIAPGHGPLYKEPNKIMDDYLRYCTYANGDGKDEVTIVWGSMYGETEKTVMEAKRNLEEKDIKVNMVQLPYSTKSDVVTNVFKAKAVIVAASTYEYKMFPPVAHAIDECGRKKNNGKSSALLWLLWMELWGKERVGKHF